MNIEVDFEVYKALTNRLEDEQDTYNAVVRRLLDLPVVGEGQGKPSTQHANWFGHGVALPVGTRLRSTYKKVERLATVRADGLELGGTLYPSLSAAAIGVVGQNTNGWTFWRYQDPVSRTWKPMLSLR